MHLEEVLSFSEYLQFNLNQDTPEETPYKSVKLGGLWKGVEITEEYISEIRQEIWTSLKSSN